MPATVSHAFSVTVADGTNEGVVRPSNWNSGHLISLSAVEGLSLSGNTSGTLTLISTGTAILAGGNNITLSQDGQSITVSAANETQTVPPIGTAVKVVETSGSIGTITRFAPEDHAHQGVGGWDVNGIASTFYGTQQLSAGDLISIATGGGTSRGSAQFINLWSSATTVSSVTSANAVGAMASRAALEGHQHAGVGPAGVSDIGNTAGNTAVLQGRLVLAGGDNITLSMSTSANNAMTVTISGGAGGAAGSNTLGMSNLGNTSGTTGVVSGSAIRYLFAGGNNVTLSQSLDGVSGTVTISAANETQTVPPIGTAVKAVQTSGSTGTITRFAPEDHAHQGVAGVDVNGIASTFYGTVQQSAGALMSIATGGNTSRGSIQFINLLSSATTVSSVATANAVGAMASRFALEGHQHGGVPTVSVVGNTAGNTTQGNLSLILAGGPNITLSGGTAAGAMTVSVSAAAPGGGAAPTLSLWLNQGIASTVNTTLPNAFLILWPLTPIGDIFPGNMTASTMFLNFTGSVPTASSHTQRLSIGFYTMVNSTQLSRIFSASTSWGTNAGNSGQNQSFAGYRWVTFHSSQFDVQPTFSQTQYWLGIWSRSSNAGSFSLHGQSHFVHTSARSGFMSAASNSATTQGWYPFNGNYSVSFTTAMPDSVAASAVNKTGISAVANVIPYLLFNNMGSNIV